MDIPKINTNRFAQNVVSDELKKREFSVIQSGRNFMVNQKIINVRGCNYDNDWARNFRTKKGAVLGGWDKLNPEKFDYLICVSFSEAFNNVLYFIFTQKDVLLLFPITTLGGRERGLKNLTLFENDEESHRIIKDSENRWCKIKR